MLHPIHNAERIDHFLPGTLAENFRVGIKVAPRCGHPTKTDGIYQARMKCIGICWRE